MSNALTKTLAKVIEKRKNIEKPKIVTGIKIATVPITGSVVIQNMNE